MDELSHVDEQGRARMVDVSGKPHVKRTAAASGHIRLGSETCARIRENGMKKGDVLRVAEIAGVQAAKRTGELIPLCHPLPLTHVAVDAALEETGVAVCARASCVGPTGVEMEALTAVSAALLTVYDMCKSIDSNMVISRIQLDEKAKEKEN